MSREIDMQGIVKERGLEKIDEIPVMLREDSTGDFIDFGNLGSCGMVDLSRQDRIVHFQFDPTANRYSATIYKKK